MNTNKLLIITKDNFFPLDYPGPGPMIETMLPNKKTGEGQFEHYEYLCIPEEDAFIYEELTKKVPENFLSDLTKSQLELFKIKKCGKGVACCRGTKLHTLLMEEIRLNIEKETLDMLKDFLESEKFKNLYVGFVRYKIGYEVGDLDGD